MKKKESFVSTARKVMVETTKTLYHFYLLASCKWNYGGGGEGGNQKLNNTGKNFIELFEIQLN